MFLFINELNFSNLPPFFFGKPFLVQLRTLVSRCIYWSFSLSFLLLQIDRASECKLGFDSTRVAALLVLAISAPLSHEQHVCSIPPRIFSYAVTLLGRIARALTDVIDQNALLTYLSRCSISTTISATEFNIKIPNDTSNEIMRMPMELAAPLGGYQLEVHDEVMMYINLILAKVKDIWPLIQSGFTNEVLRTLRF